MVETTEDGQLIETQLNNFSTPFIRYEVGDNISDLNWRECGCVLLTPYFSKISGRASQFITTGDRRKFFNIGSDQIFRGTNVVLGQIVQEAPSQITLEVVPKKQYSDTDRKRILKETHGRVGPEVLKRKRKIKQQTLKHSALRHHANAA